MLSPFALQEKPVILWFQLRTNILGSKPIYFWSTCSDWFKVRCGNRIGTCSMLVEKGHESTWDPNTSREQQIGVWRVCSRGLEEGEGENAANADGWMESGGKVWQRWKMKINWVEKEWKSMSLCDGRESVLLISDRSGKVTSWSPVQRTYCCMKTEKL